MAMYENKNEPEKAVLVSVDTGDFDAEVSIDELEELAKTAGANVLAKVIQKRERPEAATFVGMGKLYEISAICKYHNNSNNSFLVFEYQNDPNSSFSSSAVKYLHIPGLRASIRIFIIRTRKSVFTLYPNASHILRI